MKNLTKTLFAAAVTVFALTSSVVPTFASSSAATEITSPSAPRFNRISVRGNVKVILTQGEVQSVVGISNYDASKTSVRSDGKTLFIESKEDDLVTLNVTVKDLQRVQAYDKSIVVTSNNFDVKNLQVFLYQNARAKIKTTTESLYTVVKDDAVLKLNGTSDYSTMVAENMKNMKLGDFASQRSVSYGSVAIMEATATAMTIKK